MAFARIIAALAFASLGSSQVLDLGTTFGNLSTDWAAHGANLTALSPLTNIACQILCSKFNSQLYWPNTTQYLNESETFWSKTTVLSPGPYCIFAPNKSQDVADALSILKDTQTKFAVRGGGHMPVPGAADIDDGVLIVMTNLNTLTPSADKSTVTVGPGLRWGDVYSALDPYGLMVLGGRYAPVGVSGLLLGGGISHFSSLHGWCANNIVSYELVNADAKVITVSAQSYPDLFWALKGGSNNFGIVTSFTLLAYPRTDVYAGTIVYPPTQLDPFIAAIGAYATAGGGIDDPSSAIDGYITIVPSENAVLGNLVAVHNGTDPNPASFANFTALPSTLNTAHVRDYSDFQEETVAFGNRSLRDSFFTLSLKSTPEAVNLVNQTITQRALEAFADVENAFFAIIYQPVSTAWLAQAKAHGGDALDLDPSKGNFIILDINAMWSNPADDAFVYAFSTQILQELQGKLQAAGLDYPFLFMNDAGPGEEVLASYGYGSSLAKLKAIRQFHDPTAVFQRLLPGGFKVGV